jgi:hypothetical protein
MLLETGTGTDETADLLRWLHGDRNSMQQKPFCALHFLLICVLLFALPRTNHAQLCIARSWMVLVPMGKSDFRESNIGVRSLESVTQEIGKYIMERTMCKMQ